MFEGLSQNAEFPIASLPNCRNRCQDERLPREPYSGQGLWEYVAVLNPKLRKRGWEVVATISLYLQNYSADMDGEVDGLDIEGQRSGDSSSVDSSTDDDGL